MAQYGPSPAEIERRLVQLGLPDDARAAVSALLAGRPGERGAAESADFPVRVVQTLYNSVLRTTEALGSSSLSMAVMLFDLFVAHEQRRQISVSSLCLASGAAQTTALRQINLLEARGFVTREGDRKDRRRYWVRPTAKAMALIGGLVADWQALLCP